MHKADSYSRWRMRQYDSDKYHKHSLLRSRAHQWDIKSGCHFSCISKSKGIQIVASKINIRTSIQLCIPNTIVSIFQLDLCLSFFWATTFWVCRLVIRSWRTMNMRQNFASAINKKCAGSLALVCKSRRVLRILIEAVEWRARTTLSVIDFTSWMASRDTFHSVQGVTMTSRIDTVSTGNVWWANSGGVISNQGKLYFRLTFQRFGEDDTPVNGAYNSLAHLRAKRNAKRIKRHYEHFSPINVTERINQEYLDNLIANIDFTHTAGKENLSLRNM